jgi:hypothetical protein
MIIRCYFQGRVQRGAEGRSHYHQLELLEKFPTGWHRSVTPRRLSQLPPAQTTYARFGNNKRSACDMASRASPPGPSGSVE